MTSLPSGDVAQSFPSPSIHSDSKSPVPLEHETFLIQHGYYPLEFTPHTTILTNLFKNFPERYYRLYRTKKSELGGEIQPVLSLIFFTNEKKPSSAQIFQQFWHRCKDANNYHEMLDSEKSVVYDLVRGIFPKQDFLPETGSNSIKLPFQINVYGWETSEAVMIHSLDEIEGDPRHHYYTIHPDQQKSLLDYIDQQILFINKTQLQLYRKEFLGGKSGTFFRIQMWLLFASISLSFFTGMLYLIRVRVKWLLNVLFFLGASLICANAGIYFYRRLLQSKNPVLTDSWNVLVLTNSQAYDVGMLLDQNGHDQMKRLMIRENHLNPPNERISNTNESKPKGESKITTKTKQPEPKNKTPKTERIPKSDLISTTTEEEKKSKIYKFFEED